jgi:hypothetical protein
MHWMRDPVRVFDDAGRDAMPSFRAAHVREQGIDLIIVPLANDFPYKGQAEQNAIVAEIQLRANGAGLAGTVVPVWPNGSGGFGFLAPQQWHSFFSSLTPQQIDASINKEVSW